MLCSSGYEQVEEVKRLHAGKDEKTLARGALRARHAALMCEARQIEEEMGQL